MEATAWAVAEACRSGGTPTAPARPQTGRGISSQPPRCDDDGDDIEDYPADENDAENDAEHAAACSL
jgi:hypothetical protein